MSIVAILVLWTWGLTPLGVNIAGTILLGLKIAFSILKDVVEIAKEK